MAPFVCHSPCFLSNGSFSIDFTKSLRLGPLPLQHCRGSVLCLPDGFHWCRWLYCPSRLAKSLLSPSCSPLTQSTPMDLLRPTGENPVCRISNRFIHIGQITAIKHIFPGGRQILLSIHCLLIIFYRLKSLSHQFFCIGFHCVFHVLSLR